MKTKRISSISLFLVLAMMLVVGVVLAGPVGNAAGFEDDDGNLDAQAPINFDWNSFAATSWLGTAPYRESDKVVSGWTFKGIEDDQESNTDTAFAGGTKQDDECPTVKGAKAPNKGDLERVYLATKNIAGTTYLMLGWVRIPQNTTSASAHVAFEFNKGETPCGGSSDDLVERTDGDLLFVYDFEGGEASPTIKLAQWTTNPADACDIGNHNPPCWGVADDLTALGYAEAAVNVGVSVDDDIGPAGAGNEILDDSEFGEAGINLTAAGVFDEGVCESFGNVFAVSRSSGNSGNAQMKDLDGPADFTLANCGTVIIHKVTDPTGDTITDFGYTTDVTTTPASTTSPFSLKDGETNTILNVNPGTYYVTEDDPSPSYLLADIDCSDSTTAVTPTEDEANRTATFTLAAAETVECTFENNLQEGALRIEKRSTKTGNPLVLNAGAVFSYGSGSVTDNGSGDEDPTVGEICVSGLTPGMYTVNETTPPTGYGAASQTNVPVTVADDTDCSTGSLPASATAVFTNDPLADIQVNFRDGGSGETSATIECVDASLVILNPDSETPPIGWDTSETHEDLIPGTYVCTIVIDP